YDPGKRDPRLIVTAVDVVKGKAIAFDSAKEALRAAHVVASGSFPPIYPPKKVEGVYAGSYWDGGLLSNTPLPEGLDVLRGSTGVCMWTSLPFIGKRILAGRWSRSRAGMIFRPHGSRS